MKKYLIYLIRFILFIFIILSMSAGLCELVTFHNLLFGVGFLFIIPIQIFRLFSGIWFWEE